MSTVEDAFERLQSLLLEPQISELRRRSQTLDQELSHLEQKLSELTHEVLESAALVEVLRPMITELLKVREIKELKRNGSREAFSRIVAELIDVALTTKIEQDRAAMAAALAPIMPDSIAYSSEVAPEAMGRAIAPNLSRALEEQIEQDRGAIARAIAPEMGAALKEQIRLEREAVVDALYPVIGSTISRYFAELLKEINNKLEQTLSVETVTRKFKAKLQGISEAELLLREATPVRVQAAFLIQKASGLVIAEAQPTDCPPLESELIAGMLTAIRSFVSEYVSQEETVSELRDIEYGDAQICLEAAGYCYLAVMVQGMPSKFFLNGVKGILAQQIAQHGEAIQRFEGDTTTVPEAIPKQLQRLIEDAAQPPEGKLSPSTNSPGLMMMAARWAIVLVVGLAGLWSYKHHRHVWLTQKLNQPLQEDPALALYRLEVHRDRQRLVLKGYVPTESLAERAAQLVSSQAPSFPLENQIIVIQAPPMAQPTSPAFQP